MAGEMQLQREGRPSLHAQQQQQHQHQHQHQQFLNAQAHPPPSIPLPPLPAMKKTRRSEQMGGVGVDQGAERDRDSDGDMGRDSQRQKEGRHAGAGARPGAGAAAGAGAGARPGSETGTATASGKPRARAAPRAIPRSTTSSPSIPTVRTVASSLSPSPSRVPTPSLHKAVSIESFPRPPGMHVSPSPLHLSSSDKPPTLRRPQSKPSLYTLRTNRSTVSLAATTPSLIRTSKSESLLSLPSQPGSRSSSAPLSPATPITPNTPVADPVMTEPIGADKDKEAKGNITVSVRVRPDAAADSQPDGEWMVDGRRSLISYESGEYRYDNVFSPHDQNARVYESAAKRLVRRVMEGYHGTVFAYGMTGTGKTFSMQGTAISPGVIPLAITDIFSYIRQNPTREFLLRVSYLEIYNEKIYDLLNPDSNEDIKLREDPRRGVYATPLKEEIVQSPNQLLRVIARGDQQRRVAGTQFNARSSRSHAVVQIVVESRERTAGPTDDPRRDKLLPGSVLVSTLSLIDLAGSERAAESKERRTEGGHINKSLLTLGTVIARLSGDNEIADKDQKHLPYRDSKLTRLLQPALSGNSLVSILCTVQLSAAASSAAATSHTSETLNTLKFASRAKNNLVSHAKRNESNPADGADPRSRALLDRYKMEILELRTQLEAQNKVKNEAEKVEKAEDEEERWRERERESAERHEEQMLEMQLARTALKERISHLNRLILSSKSLGVNSGRFSNASSSMPVLQRTSTHSTLDRPKSRRPSSGGSQSNTSRIVSGSTVAGMLPIARTSQIELASASEDGDDDEEMAADEDALEPGSASSGRRIRALQADLADKDRYIAALEKRLLQTRNNSYSSRTGSARSPQNSPAQSRDGPNTDAVIKDKDREIEQLKQKLEDQTRMVSALRNAARKREMLETVASDLTQHPAFRQDSTSTSPDKRQPRTPFRSISRPELLRSASGPSGPVTCMSPHGSPPPGVQNFSRLSTNPVSLFPAEAGQDEIESPAEPSNHVERATNLSAKRKTVDEMTKLLDEMIQDKVDTGHVIRGDRGSLRVKRDTVMSRDAEAGAAASYVYEKAQYI